MKLIPLLASAFFLNMCLMSDVPAQDAAKLILETEPTETEIALEGALIISETGTVRATPVESGICQVTNSCEGVSVSVSNFQFAQTDERTISVLEGSDVELTWTSLGATSCTAGGTFDAWSSKGELPTRSSDASSAQRTFSIEVGDAASSPQTLTLQCANGTVSSSVGSSQTLTLEIKEKIPPSPNSCVGRDPIAGWTRLTTKALSCSPGDSSANCTTWDPTLWPNPFLKSNGLARSVLTNVSGQKQYVAIEFNTNGMSRTAEGRVNFENAQAYIKRQPVFVTISKCPGDFNSEQPTGCYFTPRNVFLWRGPDSSSLTRCVLEPDTTYYFNMLSSASPDDTDPAEIKPVAECETRLCGVLVQPN